MGDTDRDWIDSPANEPKPRQISWFWLLLGISAVYVVLIFRGGRLTSDAAGTGHPAVGRKLPTLHLTALTGDSQDVKLTDLIGDVTVINFWGTWCPPCRREFPEIAGLWSQLRLKEHFRLLAVSCGQGDDDDIEPLREETRAYLEMQQSKLPTYADPGLITRRGLAMASDDPGFSYPTTILVDQKGVIRAVWTEFDPQLASQIKHRVGELLDSKK